MSDPERFTVRASEDIPANTLRVGDDGMLPPHAAARRIAELERACRRYEEAGQMHQSAHATMMETVETLRATNERLRGERDEARAEVERLTAPVPDLILASDMPEEEPLVVRVIELESEVADLKQQIDRAHQVGLELAQERDEARAALDSDRVLTGIRAAARRAALREIERRDDVCTPCAAVVHDLADHAGKETT